MVEYVGSATGSYHSEGLNAPHQQMCPLHHPSGCLLPATPANVPSSTTQAAVYFRPCQQMCPLHHLSSYFRPRQQMCPPSITRAAVYFRPQNMQRRGATTAPLHRVRACYSLWMKGTSYPETKLGSPAPLLTCTLEPPSQEGSVD